MTDATARGAPEILRELRLPVAVLVGTVVAVAWYVTWAASDLSAMLMMAPSSAVDLPNVVLFFALLVVMMVAMMLPAALPMILTVHGISRLEAGRPTKPADRVATALFVVPYFLVWGGFSLLALFGVAALGLTSPLAGSLALLPAGVLIAAGAYQVTRTKEVCLVHCQSPMSFVMRHWRAGRGGAFRMGLHHSVYCIGCCWLFMLVLFVAGAMSLLWMGALSVAIFVEKAGPRTPLLPRAIGALLVVMGLVLGVRALGFV